VGETGESEGGVREWEKVGKIEGVGESGGEWREWGSVGKK